MTTIGRRRPESRCRARGRKGPRRGAGSGCSRPAGRGPADWPRWRSDGVVRRVRPRAAVEQIVAAAVFDRERTLGHVAGALLPVALGTQHDLRRAGRLGGAAHRLHRDAETRQLHEVQVQLSVAVAEEVRVDRALEQVARMPEGSQRAGGLGDAHGAVRREVEVEAARAGSRHTSGAQTWGIPARTRPARAASPRGCSRCRRGSRCRRARRRSRRGSRRPRGGSRSDRPGRRR